MLYKAVLTTLALAGAVFAQTAPTVDEIVAKHVAAQGGMEKVRAIKTLKISAKGVAPNGMELPISVYFKRPNLMRSETTVQSMEIVQVFDGTEAWSINPLTGAAEPTKASAEETKNTAERANSMIEGHLMDYKAKGTKVELIGKEDVEGSPAYKLKLTTKDGSTIYDYLDEASYLEVRTTSKVLQMGQEIEVDAYPGNYKPEAGVMMPHSVDQRVGGTSVMKMTIDKVDVNGPIDDAIFKFPAKASAPDAKKQ